MSITFVLKNILLFITFVIFSINMCVVIGLYDYISSDTLLSTKNVLVITFLNYHASILAFLSELLLLCIMT